MAVPSVNALARRRQTQRAFASPRLCLLAAAVGASLAGLFFWMASAPTNQATHTLPIAPPAAPLPSGPAVSKATSVRENPTVSKSRAKPGPNKTEIEAWLASETTDWSDQELVDGVLALEESDRTEVLAKLSQTYNISPAKLAPFAEKLAATWARQSAGAAILFLDRLRDPSGTALPPIVQLESKLMSDWIGRGFPAVAQSLLQQGQRAPIPATELDLLTYIVQNDEKAKLGDLLQWVAGLNGQENRALELAVSESLVRMAQPENFHQIAALLEKDLGDQRAATCISQFAARNAVESPDEVVAWLEKLAPRAGQWGSMIINDFFDQLGRTHPDTAVRLLNAGFTDEFASVSSAPSGSTPDNPPSNAPDQLYDIALSKVLSNVMVVDPDYALTCAQYFNDPRLQDHFTKTVQHLQLSGARRNRQ